MFRGLPPLGDQPGDPAIEQMLAPAVGVERLQVREAVDAGIVDKAFAAVAVGRGGRGVNQPRIILRTPVPQIDGGAEILLHDEIGIAFGC